MVEYVPFTISLFQQQKGIRNEKVPEYQNNYDNVRIHPL